MINSVKVVLGEIVEDSEKEKYRDAEMVVWIDEDNDLCLSVKAGKEIKMIFMAPELLNGLVTLAIRRKQEESEEKKAEMLAV